MNDASLRHDWSQEEGLAIYHSPFSALVHRAQGVHQAHFDPCEVQLSTLLSIKTGGCPEDCGYCSQSVHHHTDLEPAALLRPELVVAEAERARDRGATRFCMGAAWRSPKERDLPALAEMVRGVKALGLETCLTLGMLSASQAQVLKDAGLDFYNHNLDTSPAFYGRIVTTHTYADRLQTLENARAAGLSLCSGGILGLGESAEDRVALVRQLANLPAHPESVPINLLVPVEGTPLNGTPALHPFELIRTIALARILMPHSTIRLSAGRGGMSDELHALAFLAGANSIFYGEHLLTTPNAEADRDRALLARLGLRPQPAAAAAGGPA
ncbi:MAG: biotin synthase BioB [Gammaproteobacteria bacterium]|jgi:biotin synthase|nr:biotin synthase BioB [Gammaproteobacteria bacterium]